MSATAVFIFLLEQLPGFYNVLNSTVHSLHASKGMEFEGSLPHKCDPIAAQSVLNNIKDNIVLDFDDINEEYIKGNNFHQFNDVYKELSPETLYNIGTVFDNTVEDSDNFNSYETTKNIYSNKSDRIVHKEESENTIKDFTEAIIGYREDHDKDSAIATFLVAIFETSSNVTAQTCGGTLLSPHWVLTAASCVNLLSHLRRNYSRPDYRAVNVSAYTIIAGSVNPFVDGSVHRVNEITFLPTALDIENITDHSFVKKGKKSKIDRNITPSLAMMRIDPPADAKCTSLYQSNITGEEDVQVYGWILTKNDTGNEVMNATNFPAKILPSKDCRAYHRFSDDNSLLCLFPRSDNGNNIIKMNSGGPVLLQRNDNFLLVGVAQLDYSLPLLAYPIASHAATINKILIGK